MKNWPRKIRQQKMNDPDLWQQVGVKRRHDDMVRREYITPERESQMLENPMVQDGLWHDEQETPWDNATDESLRCFIVDEDHKTDVIAHWLGVDPGQINDEAAEQVWWLIGEDNRARKARDYIADNNLENEFNEWYRIEFDYAVGGGHWYERS